MAASGRSVLSFFNKARRLTIRSMAEAGTILVFGMMLLVTADVTGRYTMNSPLPGTFEIVSVLVPAIVFLGLAYAEYHKHHVRVEILTSHLSKRTQEALNIFAWLICATLFGALTWFMALEAVDATSVQEVSAGLIIVPVFPVKWLMAIGTGFLALEFLLNIVSTLARRKEHRAEKQATA